MTKCTKCGIEWTRPNLGRFMDLVMSLDGDVCPACEKHDALMVELEKRRPINAYYFPEILEAAKKE